jgi:tRNA pseudouridine32 synthase/23S rRNA pseudouridine746 synthase
VTSARHKSCQGHQGTTTPPHNSPKKQIQRSYLTRDCSGGAISLLDAYLEHARRFEPPLPLTRAGGFVGFPAGCGDCCAPKLLHAAAERGWQPVAMVEFFWGAPPGTATWAKPAAKMGAGGWGGSSSSSGSESDGDEGGGAGRGGARGGAAGASRRHGQVYGMCDKCRGVLGTMLHGLPDWDEAYPDSSTADRLSPFPLNLFEDDDGQS